MFTVITDMSQVSHTRGKVEGIFLQTSWALGCDAVYSNTNVAIFWNNRLLPTSILNVEVAGSSKTSVNSYHNITQLQI